MGRFLIKTLEKEGCNTCQLKVNDMRLTALVVC